MIVTQTNDAAHQHVHTPAATIKRIDLLHGDVAELLKDIHLLKIENYHIRQRTRIFVDRYLEEIADIIDTQPKASPLKRPKSKGISLPSLRKLQEQNLDKLYRSLAKKVHPDHPQGSHTAFVAYQNAYKNRDIKRMYYIWVGQEMLSSNNYNFDKLLKRLTLCQEQLFLEYQRLNDQQRSLMKSNGYDLRERIIRATLAGVDVIQAVKREFKPRKSLPKQ